MKVKARLTKQNEREIFALKMQYKQDLNNAAINEAIKYLEKHFSKEISTEKLLDDCLEYVRMKYPDADIKVALDAFETFEL